MANTYKNIVITPNIGSAVDDPKIVFSGANTSTNTDITLRVYPTSNGTVSFEGSAGQLFSVTNQLTGTLFSVNDVSGIPSIEVLDTGLIKFAQYNGSVVVGSANSRTASNSNTTGKMVVYGGVGVNGDVYANNFISTNYPTVLNDITSQLDGAKSVFNLTVDQANVTSIMDSKNLEVFVNGARLSPYVKELRYPWITPYDSFKGYRVSTQNTASNTAQTLTIYNSPGYGEQAILTIINSSSSPQTKKYPYSAATIALGD